MSPRLLSRFALSLLVGSLCLTATTSLTFVHAAPAPSQTRARAAEPVKSLSISSGRTGQTSFQLAGRDATQQLVVTGVTASGLERDLTQEVKYETTPAGVIAVDATGLVTPLKEGTATIKAKHGGGNLTATVTASVTHLVQDIPVSFTHLAVPIFTKFGCNGGGCHGKAEGQNGFKLSLLGFEPQEDYDYLVHEGRNRRLFPTAPDQSLLLLKATGLVPHGGGKRIDVDSAYYRVLRRWIEQGCPRGSDSDPEVVRIEVFPKERLLERGSQQQLQVIAHLSNGSTIDVTRMTQFDSNLTDMAEVTGTGLVKTKQLPGSAAIMTRYQSHVDVFRATVPLGARTDQLPPAKNFVDELVFARLKKLGLPPSVLCDDATFIRRVTIDITGRIPTLKETEEFLQDKRSTKREELVDRLLASSEYADYFANKWSSILRNRRRSATDDPKPTAAFHVWIRTSLHENKPYDQFVREIITSTGKAIETPQVIWYREVKDAYAQLEDVAQLFLGQRIACARCHHHPFEKWSQQDYYGFSAFFSNLKIKDPPPPKMDKKKNDKDPKPEEKAEVFTVEFKPGKAEATHPRTGKKVLPAGLGSEPVEISNDVDPRVKMVDWMADPANPYFARTLANRYWKHFFSRGLVDPEDDMRVTNPATNQELLDALAKHFVESKYDLKQLIRTMCNSTVYQLSAVPNEHNADDRQNFSRFVPKRLNAEVLLDAVDEVTATKTSFKGMPSGMRAVQLPDNMFDSYFLSVFGRPDSASACECERKSDASLAQCLHLFNSQEVLSKVSGNRASQLSKDKRPHAERIRELYLIALSREPSPEELSTLVNHVEKHDKPQTAYEDVIWAVLNTKEFLFNH